MSGSKVAPKSGAKRTHKVVKMIRTKSGKTIEGMDIKVVSQGRTRHPATRAKFEPPEWSNVEGIPSERDIAEQIRDLSKEHARTFQTLMTTLADHLGSSAAARLWLATPHSGYGEAPINLIVAGRIDAVVKAQEAIWGPDPAYA